MKRFLKTVLASCSALFLSMPLMAKVHTVKPGEKIMAAVKKAKVGDTIQVMPGTYSETIYVDKDSITLSGVVVKGKRPLLDGKKKLNDAILLGADNPVVENFHIKDYKGNGIMTQGSNNFIIRKNIIGDTGIYGIFPQYGINGLIVDNVVWGIEDAAIYVGMSNHIDVIRNEVFRSVAGIEIENTSNSLVEGNMVYDNTGGILAFLTPGLPIKKGENIIIRNNFVVNNNTPNFAAPGTVVSNVPAGSGLMIIASDKVIIQNNIIRGNDTGGILITDLDILGGTPDPEMDPRPENIQILENLFYNNGNKPAGAAKAILDQVGRKKGADLIATGKMRRNCAVNQKSITVVTDKKFKKKCKDQGQSAKIASMMLPEKVKPKPLSKKAKGELVYRSLCTGCHAYNIVLIGPSVKDIQQLYPNNEIGYAMVADFATKPIKKRPQYPPMPPQNYLPRDMLLEAAKTMLNRKN